MLNGVVSILTPGPMVEQTVALLTYLPLATAGFALITAAIRLAAFSTSFSAEKLTLPTGAWMMPVLSTRNSTLPALISWMALTTAAIRLAAFSTSFSAEKLTLPTGAWMMPVLSTRNSTLPALISWMALT